MLNRKKLTVSSVTCVVAALTLCVGPAPAVAKKKKKTTVIGQVTHQNLGTPGPNGEVRASILNPAILTTRTVKKPKKGSITVNVTATPFSAATPNSIYVSGVVQCKKSRKGSIGDYAIGGEYDGVPSPFTTKAPFPYGVPKPAACQLSVSSNMDPPTVTGLEPYPPATISITVLWRH